MSGDTLTTFVDRLGDEYRLSRYSPGDREALTEMYDCFAPKAITQGLPPADTQARLAWIEDLTCNGENFLAWLEDKVVGHASLIQEPARGTGEYLIFVNLPYRNRGLGTELTHLAIDRARQMGLCSVWLTVEALNFRAIKLYKKMGFVFRDSGERERTMMLKL